MITLATLPQATAQEVFDQGARHLLTQGVRAFDDEHEVCVYRYGALRCVGGCFIADDEYNPGRMEQKDWYELVGAELAPAKHADLIRRMQSIHDVDDPKTWAQGLRRLAAEYGLSPAVLA